MNEPVTQTEQWYMDLVNEESNRKYMDRINEEANLMGPTVKVRVARMFFDDHWSRDLFTGRIESMNKRTVTLTLDGKAFDELLSDAKYYSEEAAHYDMPAECASATRVVAALHKAIDSGNYPRSDSV